MRALRAGIDAIDADLVALLAERARYIDRAAALKRENGLPARIPARVDEVVARVKAHAAAGGLDPALAEALWRQLIEWAIAREERMLAGTPRAADTGKGGGDGDDH